MNQSIINLQIDEGSITFMINKDEERIITFNPLDALFADKFYRIIEVFEAKDVELQKEIKKLAAVKEVDKHGLPINTAEGLALMIELCDYCRDQIDDLFGEGTSQTAFGDVRVIEQIEQFFLGVTPYIKKARETKIKQYTKKKTTKVMK